MSSIAKLSRGPPKPVCAIQVEPYYDIRGAVQIIESVSESTFRRWMINGWTSFGLSLDVIQRNGRLLIPELKVQVLRELFEESPLPWPGAPGTSVRNSARPSRMECLTTFGRVTPIAAAVPLVVSRFEF